MRLQYLLALAACTAMAHAEVTTVVDYNDPDTATPRFHFAHVPPPGTNGTVALKITLIDGQADPNGGDLDKLTDGLGPTEEDQPDQNFFFRAGTDGGRLLFDLNQVTTIHQIDSYSWHPGSRAPQVYQLYGATGAAADFNARPKRGTDPLTNGWQHLATVDTRPKNGKAGGQYGVSLRDSAGPLGDYRFLLFDCSATETTDTFGNTFYSEIDVRNRALTAADFPGDQHQPHRQALRRHHRRRQIRNHHRLQRGAGHGRMGLE